MACNETCAVMAQTVEDTCVDRRLSEDKIRERERGRERGKVLAPSRHTRRLCLRRLHHHGALVVCAIAARHLSRLCPAPSRHSHSILRHHGTLTLPFAGIVHLFRVLKRCSYSNFSCAIAAQSPLSSSSAPSRHNRRLRHHGTLLTQTSPNCLCCAITAHVVVSHVVCAITAPASSSAPSRHNLAS